MAASQLGAAQHRLVGGARAVGRDGAVHLDADHTVLREASHAGEEQLCVPVAGAARSATNEATRATAAVLPSRPCGSTLRALPCAGPVTPSSVSARYRSLSRWCAEPLAGRLKSGDAGRSAVTPRSDSVRVPVASPRRDETRRTAVPPTRRADRSPPRARSPRSARRPRACDRWRPPGSSPCAARCAAAPRSRGTRGAWRAAEPTAAPRS